MVQPPPGSLSEGAAERSEAEGVSFDGCSGPTVYPPAHMNSEIFERLRSSGDTPSVSRSLDSSLREGAGMGCVPFNVSPGCRKVAGDFHRPYGGLLPFIEVHSLSQPFGLTAPSEREPGRAFAIQRAARMPEGCGRFSSPLRRAFAIHRGRSKIFRFPTQKRYRVGQGTYRMGTGPMRN